MQGRAGSVRTACSGVAAALRLRCGGVRMLRKWGGGVGGTVSSYVQRRSGVSGVRAARGLDAAA